MNWRGRFSAWSERVTGWVNDQMGGLRREAVRILQAVGDPEPAGGIVQQHFTIDDGVDYSLPLVVPTWLSDKQREEYITAAIQEADSQYHFQFDKPYLYSENPSQLPTASPLLEWDQHTRIEAVSRSHLAYERNPLANSAVALTTLFAIGEGLTVTYSNPDVEQVLEDFRANPENDVEGYEKSLCRDLMVDGELFIRFFTDGDGQTVIVPLLSTEFLWVVSQMGFKRRLELFHRQAVQTTGFPGSIEYIIEDIPAGEMLHVAINRHSYEVRGRPELFRILPWLKAYKDWLEGRARQNHWRGSILYHVTLTGVQPGGVTAKRAQYKQPPSPGSLVITNEKEAWEVMESKVGAADVSADGRQIKLMSAVGVKLPEYMLSDGENANLATASAQQLPALRTFGEVQDIHVNQVWRPIYRHVLANAIAAGILPERVQKYDTSGDLMTDDSGQPVMIDTLKAFDVQAPELESDDPFNLAQALGIAADRGWASDETASSKMGFDYTAEQKKRDRAAAADRDKQAAGLAPSGFHPPQKPVADFNPQDNFDPSAVRPVAGPDGKVDPATGAPNGQEPSSSALANESASTKAAPTVVRVPITVPAPGAAIPERQAGRLPPADLAERDQLLAVQAVLESIGSAKSAPARLAIDDELVRWVRRGAPARDLAPGAVASRDEQGRVAGVSHRAKDGLVVYQVKRTAQGKLIGLERMETGD